MSDKAIHTEIIGKKAVIVCINDNIDEERIENNNFFSVKVVDLWDNHEQDQWSLNKGCDMAIVIKSLITRDFTLLATGSEYLVAFRNDLERNGIISKETNDLIDELRKDKKPEWII